MMEQFQTLQQPVIRLVETKAWETPGPHLRRTVKGAALTGCLRCLLTAPTLSTTPVPQHLWSSTAGQHSCLLALRWG